MSNINHDYIEDFIFGILPQSDGLLKEIEEYAKINNVPIITKDVRALLQTIIIATKPKKILEIGSAIGYSAILMAMCLEGDFSITTIERNKEYIEIAKGNINACGFSNNINIIEGSAEEVLPSIEGPFDIIFVDAAKGQYMDFFRKSINNLKIGGLFICDNVLFRGMVAERSLLIRRKITIVKRLQKFLKYIANNDSLKTSIIPIGDGVSISCKIKEVEAFE